MEKEKDMEKEMEKRLELAERIGLKVVEVFQEYCENDDVEAALNGTARAIESLYRWYNANVEDCFTNEDMISDFGWRLMCTQHKNYAVVINS